MTQAALVLLLSNLSLKYVVSKMAEVAKPPDSALKAGVKSFLAGGAGGMSLVFVGTSTPARPRPPGPACPGCTASSFLDVTGKSLVGGFPILHHPVPGRADTLEPYAPTRGTCDHPEPPWDTCSWEVVGASCGPSM